jgi:hypothetical protein
MQSRRVASPALGSWHVVLALSDAFILRVAANGEWVLLGEGGRSSLARAIRFRR